MQFPVQGLQKCEWLRRCSEKELVEISKARLVPETRLELTAQRDVGDCVTSRVPPKGRR